MKEGKITVGVVSWFSSEQIKDLFNSLVINASYPETIEFLICDNTGGKDAKLREPFEVPCRILDYSPMIPKDWKPRRALGSYAHGLGLNFLMTQTKTEYCLFSDPDCIVLTKDWDIKLKSLLDKTHIAVGAPYHASKIAKYHNFPSPIFTFFNTTAYKSIHADWIPYRLPLLTLITDQLRRIPAITGGILGCKLWGRSFYLGKTAALMRLMFGNSGKDTGWRIPIAARKNGYTARLFTTALTSNQLASSFREKSSVIELMNEYELFLLDGIPFVTHLYSSTRREGGNLMSATDRWQSLAWSMSEGLKERK